jgi:hypothetical protein
MDSIEHRAAQIRSAVSSNVYEILEAIDALVAAIDIDTMGYEESDAISTLAAHRIIDDPRLRTYKITGQVTVSYEVLVTTNMSKDDLEEAVGVEIFNAVDEVQERIFDNPNDPIEDIEIRRWFTDAYGANIDTV